MPVKSGSNSLLESGVDYIKTQSYSPYLWQLDSRVASVLDSGAEGLGSNRSRDAVG